MQRLWPWLAAILSGVLGAASLPPFDQTWLCWLALTPLIAAVFFSGEEARRRWLRDLGLGYVAGLTFFWISFFWLTTVTALGWFVLQFYMAIYYALWAAFCGLMRPRETSRIVVVDKWTEMLSRANPETLSSSSPWLRSGHNLFLAVCLATAWTGLEWTRGWLFSGLGWDGLWVALHATWPMIHSGQISGGRRMTLFAASSTSV